METKITKTFSNEGSRNEVRMRVVDIFSQEQPGTGKRENASKYIYYVETLKDGNRVYLQRPGNLHNGFDFIVCVENTNYSSGKRARNFPKHEDIANDLKLKKVDNSEMYKKLYDLLKKAYDCHDLVSADYDDIKFSVGLPVDHILFVTKWLFIEQDIRYWNYSGRNMLWDLIPKKD